VEYLTVKYGDTTPSDPEDFTLTFPKLKVPEPRRIRLDSEILDQYRYRSPYLAGRGISENVQRIMSIGYDRKSRAVTFPWFNPDGTLGNVKYRKTDAKTFWYASGGRPLREMIYGIHIAYQRRITRAAIVEAEVDALTLMSAGIYAIATGGTAFTAAKRDLISRSPIEELTLFRDNDPAGRIWRNRIITELGSRMDMRLAYMPNAYKDVNEWGSCGGNLRKAYDRARKCRKLTVNIR